MGKKIEFIKTNDSDNGDVFHESPKVAAYYLQSLIEGMSPTEILCIKIEVEKMTKKQFESLKDKEDI